MKFDSSTGCIDILPGLSLGRGMTRKDVMASSADWEEWDFFDNAAIALRSIIRLPNKNVSPRTMLVVYVRPEDQLIAFWNISLGNVSNGPQKRPEGKYKNLMRSWFKDMFDTQLPCSGEWGHIDASYDPWNQYAGVVCNYRERFIDEHDWNVYKSQNKIK